MTIAGFYLSPEGVVLGADSTASLPAEQGMHFFNFTQKLFEIGENSTLGLLTYGCGGLGDISYRTLLALLADDLAANPANSVSDVAQRWLDLFWSHYPSFVWVQRCALLNQKQPHDSSANPPDPNSRTADEESELANLIAGLRVGFCIAGYMLPDRVPTAAEVFFEPLAGKPNITCYTQESQRWWGVPNIIDRLVIGADSNLINSVMSSGHWNGTRDELEALIHTQRFNHGSLPMRDAVDYVYSCIHSTIKAMKFSSMSQVCGGPIEIAVITTDRKFRWVRHKSWDAAITDGDI